MKSAGVESHLIADGESQQKETGCVPDRTETGALMQNISIVAATVQSASSPAPDGSDECMLRYIQAVGCPSAFEVLHARHKDWVWKLARTYVTDSDASDIAQEAFIYLWKKIPLLTFPCSVNALLATVVRHKSLDILRKQRRWNYDHSVELETVISNPPSCLESCVSNVLLEFQSCLTPEQYRMLCLRYEVGLSLEELARWEAVPLGTMKRRIHEIMKKLRKMKKRTFFGGHTLFW